MRLIIEGKYKYQNNLKDLSPFSPDGQASVDNLPNKIKQEIYNFPINQFFERVLRKRTNLFGISKDYKDILVAKSKQLNKSLTAIEGIDEKPTLQIFKLLIGIA